MVAIVSGNSLGLERTSLGVVGGRGVFGQAAQGQSGELVYINAATGNLVIQRRDEYLVGQGLDVASVRTYNSLGQLGDDNGDQWSVGIYAQQLQQVGVVNQAGSSLILTGRDGTQNTYSWDGSGYRWDDPVAGRQRITYAGGDYLREDSRSGLKETYRGGRLISQTDAEGKTLQYAYYSDANRAGLLQSVTDANGDITRYDYSGDGKKQLLSIIKDLKQADGSFQSQTTVRYQYDGANRLESIRVDLTPEGDKVYVTSYTYVGTSDRIKTLKQNGQLQLSLTYDTQGRIKTYTDAVGGGTTTFSYETGQTRITDAQSKQWLYVYDSEGRLTQTVSPAVGGTSLTQGYTYDSAGRLTSYTDGASQTERYTYDDAGNLLTQTDAQGRSVQYSWSSANQLLTQTSSSLIEPTFAQQGGLNFNGGVISKKGTQAAWGAGFLGAEGYMGAASLSFTVQQANRQLAIGLARLKPTNSYVPENINWGFDCGGDGKLRARVNGTLVDIQAGGLSYQAGDVLQISYDAGQVRFYKNGQQVYSVSASGADVLTGALYLQGSFYGAGGGIKDLRWGADSQAQHIVRNVYDSANARRLRYQISAEGRVTEYRYNADGQRIEERRYTQRSYSDPAPTLALLDAWAAEAVNTQQVQRSVYSYDALGQLDTIKQAQGSEPLLLSAQHLYDSAGRLRQVIRPGSDAGDQAGDALTAYAYDGLGRQLLQATTWGDGANAASSQTVTAYFDGGAQNRIEVTTAGGGILIQNLDAAGRLIGTQRSTGGPATTQSTLAYDSLGRLVRRTDAAGARSFLLYDEAGRLTGQVVEQGQDANGQAVGRLTEYRYDAASRLMREHSYAAGVLLSAFYGTDGQPQVNPPSLASLRPVDPLTDTQGSDVRRIWSTTGQLAYQIDVQGGVTAYQYDGEGRLVLSRQYAALRSQADLPTLDQMRQWEGANANPELDRSVRQFYDGDGLRVAELDGEGYLSRYTYDSAGRLVVTTRSANAVAQALRAGGSLDAIIPANNPGQDQTQTLYYNGRGLLIGQVDAEGWVTQNTYNRRGLLRSQTRYAERPASAPDWKASFTALVASLPSQSGRTRSLTYTRDDQLLTETNHEGTVTRYSYDSARRLVQVTAGNSAAEQRSVLTRWDAFGRKVAQVSGEGAAAVLALPGNATQAQIDAIWVDRGEAYRWDASDRLIQQTDANGQVSSYYYSLAGQLTHSLNQRGEVTENRYDILGRRTDELRYGQRVAGGAGAGGVLSQAVRDALAVMAGAADTSRTQYQYDRTGRLSSVQAPDGAQSLHSYNAFGELQQSDVPWQSGSAINTARRTDSFSYDRRGLLVRREMSGEGLAAGTASRTEYDAFGRVSARIDALERRTAYSWDRLGRQIQVKDALQQTRDTAYDAFGQVLSVNDAGQHTTYSYDAAERSVTVTTEEGVSVTTTHDRFGQSVSVVDGNGHKTRYTYDRDGNLSGTYLTPSGQTETKLEGRTYDHGGRLFELTDAAGKVTSYQYSDANATLTRTVDVGGLALTTVWQYDAKGQTVRETVANTWVTEYGWDTSGRRVSRTLDPAGLKLRTEWAYDAQGREVTLTVKGTNASEDRVTTYRYDAAGRRVSETRGPDSDTQELTRRYVYDKADQLVLVYDEQGHASRYAWDALGRQVLSVNAAGDASETAYDANGHIVKTTRYANRLAGGDADGDATGVWSEAVIRGKIRLNANDRIERQLWDQDGRLSHRIDATGAVTAYQLDGNGNVTRQTRYASRIAVTGTEDIIAAAARAVVANPAADQFSRFAWDAQNRLTHTGLGQRIGSADSYAVSANVYDAMGRLIQRTEYSKTVGADAALSSVKATAADDRTTRWAYDAAGREIYQADALGGVTQTTYDGAGHVRERLEIAKPIAAGTALTAPQIDLYKSAADRQSRYLWDQAGRMSRVIDALGGVTDYSRWASGEVKTETRYATALGGLAIDATIATSPNDRIQRYSYDRAGRLISHTDAMDVVETTSYWATGEIKTLTRAQGASEESTTAYEYDRAGRQTRITTAQGDAQAQSSVTRTYTAFGQVATEVSALGNALLDSDSDWASAERARILEVNVTVANLSQEQRDDLIALIADPTDGYTSHYSYNQRGECTEVRNAAGATTRTTYDALGNAVKIEDPLGNLGYFYYDNLGRVTLQVDTERYVTETTYDTSFGKDVKTLTRRYNRIDASVNLSEDSRPAVTASASMDARQLSNSYDKLGRLTSSTTPAGTDATTWDVATNRWDKTVTNALGGSTQLQHDKLGHVLTEVILVDQARDAQGNLIKDDKGNPIDIKVENRYEYNTFGDRTLLIEAYGATEQRTTELRYDKASRVTHKIGMAFKARSPNDADLGMVRPVEVTQYDALGRVVLTAS